jgi:hypothetical protein
MSTQGGHDAYIADLDEEQLESLMEKAKRRQYELQQAGWVALWVVSDDMINRAWFPKADYMGAASELVEIAKRLTAKDFPVELYINQTKMRPVEAEKRVKATAEAIAKRTKAEGS